MVDAVDRVKKIKQGNPLEHTHLTVDVVKGRGAGFSVEAPEGVRFMIRSRLMTDAESEAFGLV